MLCDIGMPMFRYSFSSRYSGIELEHFRVRELRDEARCIACLLHNPVRRRSRHDVSASTCERLPLNDAPPKVAGDVLVDCRWLSEADVPDLLVIATGRGDYVNFRPGLWSSWPLGLSRTQTPSRAST